jgi:hypothetical protein
MKRDDLKLLVWKDFIAPEAKNAVEWAKHQFWTWYLLKRRPSVGPYDGFDYMLLMVWVSRKFSGLNDLPYALHYWDMRMPNIVVDKEDNLLAYKIFLFANINNMKG